MMQRRQRRLFMILAFSALAGVAFFLFFEGRTPPVETDPLRIRAESAVSLGEELASLARSQFENLAPLDRIIVEKQVLRLENSVAAARKLLNERVKGEALLHPLTILEEILDEILVPAKAEVPKEGSGGP
ncbi:MAG: hypothetical protein GX791_07320 [Synergistaceae bacterium]|nr:hypothetical protein [Synergistaceae bacterium]